MKVFVMLAAFFTLSIQADVKTANGKGISEENLRVANFKVW